MANGEALALGGYDAVKQFVGGVPQLKETAEPEGPYAWPLSDLSKVLNPKG